MFDWITRFFSRSAAAQGSTEFAKQLLAQSWEAYRLARRDRPNEHNQPQPYSGNAAIESSHEMMNRRVRDIVRNTAQGKRIAMALSDLVIGRGMQTFSWPFAPAELLDIVTELDTLSTGQLGPRLTYALESDDYFEQWANDPEQFDAEGRLSWPEMQQLMLSETAQVGNGIMVRVRPTKYELVPLAFQMIEREQLDETADRERSAEQNKIVGGVEFDRQNRIVAYHVFVDHPHDAGSMNGSSVLGVVSPGRRTRIRAERVIDLAKYHRPSAALGASWFDASGQTTWDRDSYIDSEIRAAAVDAVFSFVAKLKDAAKYGALGFDDSLDDDDEHGNRQFKVGHSPVASVIEPDESLEMVRQTRPNKDAPAFLSLLDRDTAAAHGFSYYRLTGDYERTNFSSSRAAKLDEDEHIKPLQDWFGCHVALPVRREFNQLAAAAGLFSTVTPSEFLANRRSYQRFDVIANGRDLLDPFKEGEARTSRLRTGLSTFKAECAKANIHWVRQLMQIAIERRVQDMFGVELDFTKAGNGQQQAASQQNAESAAQQVAEAIDLLRSE